MFLMVSNRTAAFCEETQSFTRSRNLKTLKQLKVVPKVKLQQNLN